MNELLRFGSLVAIASAVLLQAPEAAACSCIRPPEPTAAMHASDHVALVRVTNISPAGQAAPMPGSLSVELEVERAFKGAESEPLVVVTAGNSAACGFHFERGQRYLVYANDTEQGSISVSLCSRTQLASQASADLAELEAANPAPSPTPPADTEPPDAASDSSGPETPMPAPAEAGLESTPNAAPQTPPSQPPSDRGCACSHAAAGSGALVAPLLGLLAGMRRSVTRRRGGGRQSKAQSKAHRG